MKDFIYRGDLHVHPGSCQWEDENRYQCGFSENELLELASGMKNLDFAAVLSHPTDPARPSPPSIEFERRVYSLKNIIDAYNLSGKFRTKLFWGVESSVLPGGILDISEELAKSVDILVVGRHGLLSDEDRDEIRESYLKIIETRGLKIIAHPDRFIDLLSGYDWEEIFKKANDFGVAIEHNIAWPLRSENIRILSKVGNLVTIGSNSHRVENLEGLSDRIADLRSVGITTERVVNSWTLPEVEEWLKKK